MLIILTNKIENFFGSINGKSIAFIGVGVSHRELMKLFAKKGAKLTLLDRQSAENLGDDYVMLKDLGCSFCLGDRYLDNLEQYDMVFRTPGMYFGNEKLQQGIKNGAKITSEMEMFFELCPCELYAVTGSDGKTTTTSLIAEILKKSGKTVHLGGNIGRALLPIIEDIKETDKAVVELSSFQLFSMRQGPNTAVVTNISPNHLDVHGTMEEYTQAKANMIKYQPENCRTVFNADNEASKVFYPMAKGKIFQFSMKDTGIEGSYCDKKGDIYFKDTKIMNEADIKIPGKHNVENFLAAIAALWGRVEIEDIKYTAQNFGGVAHRIEFVKEVGGVRYYNDSIATSPTRVIAGLRSFDKKIIVIAGGYDKKIPFEPMAPVVNEKVKILILTGMTSDKIEKAVMEDTGYKNSGITIVKAEDMEKAVKIASEMATDGDIVTLSPACASFDCYKNFEIRGEHFKDLVNKL